MHPNGGLNNLIKFDPLIWFEFFYNVFVLNRIDLTFDDQVILHLLLPEVVVRSVELP